MPLDSTSIVTLSTGIEIMFPNGNGAFEGNGRGELEIEGVETAILIAVGVCPILAEVLGVIVRELDQVLLIVVVGVGGYREALLVDVGSAEALGVLVSVSEGTRQGAHKPLPSGEGPHQIGMGQGNRLLGSSAVNVGADWRNGGNVPVSMLLPK